MLILLNIYRHNSSKRKIVQDTRSNKFLEEGVEDYDD